jgi:hypothetical protein
LFSAFHLFQDFPHLREHVVVHLILLLLVTV